MSTLQTLIKVQLELKAPKSQRNSFGNYNYRSCEDILEAVKPINGAYGATVTSVNDRFYRLIVDSGNIQARVALTSSDELLTRGDRVTLLVYGYDEKRNYVWGACHKV